MRLFVCSTKCSRMFIRFVDCYAVCLNIFIAQNNVEVSNISLLRLNIRYFKSYISLNYYSFTYFKAGLSCLQCITNQCHNKGDHRKFDLITSINIFILLRLNK